MNTFEGSSIPQEESEKPKNFQRSSLAGKHRGQWRAPVSLERHPSKEITDRQEADEQKINTLRNELNPDHQRINALQREFGPASDPTCRVEGDNLVIIFKKLKTVQSRSPIRNMIDHITIPIPDDLKGVDPVTIKEERLMELIMNHREDILASRSAESAK
jgi:hypothetical protein